MTMQAALPAAISQDVDTVYARDASPLDVDRAAAVKLPWVEVLVVALPNALFSKAPMYFPSANRGILQSSIAKACDPKYWKHTVNQVCYLKFLFVCLFVLSLMATRKEDSSVIMIILLIN